jgi:hypothetical protein
VPQDHLALGIKDEADIKETVLDFGVASFGLGHDEGIVLFGDFAQFFGLLAWNVDGALSCKLDVIEVKYLVIKSLKCAFRKGDESHGKIKA